VANVRQSIVKGRCQALKAIHTKNLLRKLNAFKVPLLKELKELKDLIDLKALLKRYLISESAKILKH
jgi:hypothetical protein